MPKRYCDAIDGIEVGDAVGDRDLAGVLGFDPLGVLRALLKR